jgi:hypothetical protein
MSQIEAVALGNPQIVVLPAMRFVRCRVISAFPEAEAVRRLERWLADQTVDYQPRRFGFDVEVTPAQQQAGLRGFEAWWSLMDGLSPTDGLGTRQFSGGEYAVFSIDLPFQQDFLRAPAGWRRLHEWVIQSGCYCTGSHQWLEEWIPRQVGGRLKLYHPVMRMTFQGEKPVSTSAAN